MVYLYDGLGAEGYINSSSVSIVSPRLDMSQYVSFPLYLVTIVTCLLYYSKRFHTDYLS